VPERKARIERATGETNIKVSLDLDGTGKYRVATGMAMLDHLVAQLARHGRFDMDVAAKALSDPDGHHMAEDLAIVLGRAFSEALGERQGITRMGHAIVPLDEALALVAVDVGGRGYAVIDAPMDGEKIGDMPSDMVRHVLETLAREAKINLHARILAGVNDHHRAEALFKALARALDQATRRDPRTAGQAPSTKGVIER